VSGFEPKMIWRHPAGSGDQIVPAKLNIPARRTRPLRIGTN